MDSFATRKKRALGLQNLAVMGREESNGAGLTSDLKEYTLEYLCYLRMNRWHVRSLNSAYSLPYIVNHVGKKLDAL